MTMINNLSVIVLSKAIHAFSLQGVLIWCRSEANDVALRIAKEVTGGTEVIAVDK